MDPTVLQKAPELGCVTLVKCNEQCGKSNCSWMTTVSDCLFDLGGLPRPKGMLAEKLPDWLLEYCERISALDAFAGKVANHVLVNEYKQGEGIMVLPTTSFPLIQMKIKMLRFLLKRAQGSHPQSVHVVVQCSTALVSLLCIVLILYYDSHSF